MILMLASLGFAQSNAVPRCQAPVDVGSTVEEARQVLNLERRVIPRVQETLDTLRCAEQTNRRDIGRLWEILGVAAFRQDADSAEAREHFAQACAVNPEPWNELSTTHHFAYRAACNDRELVGLSVGPVPAGAIALVDGEARELPGDLRAGTHLIQVRGADGIVYSEVIEVSPPTHAVNTGLAPSVPNKPPQPAKKRGGSAVGKALMVVGGAGLVAGGAFAVKSAVHNSRVKPYNWDPDAGPTSGLEWQRMYNSRSAALALGGGGAALFTAGMVMSF